MTSTARFPRSLASWSFGALAAGAFLGIVGQTTGYPGLWVLAGWIEPLGTLWLNALQMAVIPLVITQLLTALVRGEDGPSVGSLGGKALVLFVVILTLAGTFSLAVSRPVLGLVEDPDAWSQSVSVESIPEAALERADAEPLGLGEWLVGLVPRNPLQAAAEGNLLQTLLFTVLVGLAISRLPPEGRKPLAGLFSGLADAMMVMVGWILWGTPLGVFSLFLPLTLENGLGALGFIALYLILTCGVLLAVTFLLYPISAAAGRTSIRRFARALAPAQVVAMSTQSSLASLPALVMGGRDHLNLPEEATAFVLPLSVSTFKINPPVSEATKLLFLAFVFGIPLTLAEQASFMFGVIILSFGVPGVPRGIPFMTLPLHLAVGIPIEGLVLLEAVKTIPDIFMTLANVTADMSVATILSRESRVRKPAPVPSTPELAGGGTPGV